MLVPGNLQGVRLWLHRAVLRPTYLRVAPGVVQIVSFRLWGSRPSILSFPMTAGTIAVPIPLGRGLRRLSLGLWRHGVEDEIPLWSTRDPTAAAETIWRALTSTAPTPPLADDALVG